MSKLKPALILAITVIMVTATVVNVAYAQQKPQLMYTIASYLYTPSAPNWNPYAPSNLYGIGLGTIPFAIYSGPTNQLYPVLAENWTVQVLPNGSGILTIHLRKGLYWFNGSAAMPLHNTIPIPKMVTWYIILSNNLIACYSLVCLEVGC